jgi:predicted nucleic acid-binding protein
MLVDTSVWIDLFAGRDTPQVGILEQTIGRGDDIALCGIILTEILQGIRDDRQFQRVRRDLQPVLMLPIIESTFVRAAELFRQLRKQGLTIRKTNDCIIAATAIEHGVPLLHNDRDFDTLAGHTELTVIDPEKPAP